MASLFDRLARAADSREPASLGGLWPSTQRSVSPDDGRIGLVARSLAETQLSRRRVLGLGGAAAVWLALGRTPPAWGQGNCSCPTCGGPGGLFCTAPPTPSYQTCTGGGATPTPFTFYCPPAQFGTSCCSSSVPTAATCCFAPTTCCKGAACCGGSDPDCCVSTTADSQGLYTASCCPAGSPCNPDGTCGTPCPTAQQCGSNCCPPGQSCCDPQRGLCCDSTVQCCFTTNSQHPICCSPGYECAQQITLGGAIPPGSPRVCCPPNRTVTFTGNTGCCPPGSVHQPGGGVSANGGLCCTTANVCGQQCCDSLPGFPMTCSN